MYVQVCISCYSRYNSISSRGDYSRAASISFRACSGAATIRERRLFERGVYSVIYGMQGCDLFHVDGQSSRTEDKREPRLVIENIQAGESSQL